MRPFDFEIRTRAVFRDDALSSLGELARSLGFTRSLVVGDAGIVAAGFVDRAVGLLRDAGVETTSFHAFEANPDSAMVEAGRVHAAAAGIDSIVAIGGGSSLDCAKGINFVLTNGGSMRDYRGYGKTTRPMLPMIGVPTTAGTGSGAQSYALISDPVTHEKMACGDPGAAFRIAILDPSLTVSQPREITATAGYDALSHAVESFVTARRTDISDLFARSAWRLLHDHFARVLDAPDDLEARGAMLVGSHQAGIAIEHSMLGATHACANPLTAQYGTPHGEAIAVMLPHVVRWNGATVGDRYADLLRTVNQDDGQDSGDRLAARLAGFAEMAGLAVNLRAVGAARDDLPRLAAAAATQWTGTFNPRPFDAAAALALYERAW